MSMAQVIRAAMKKQGVRFLKAISIPIAYILDPQKTDDAFYVSSYGCAASDAAKLYRIKKEATHEIYGELSERSKVRHSKCRVPKRNLGFESLTLRQKPSHIKAFAHMTGLFSQGHIGVHDFRQELRCASRSALCPAESGYCPLHLPR